MQSASYARIRWTTVEFSSAAPRVNRWRARLKALDRHSPRPWSPRMCNQHKKHVIHCTALSSLPINHLLCRSTGISFLILGFVSDPIVYTFHPHFSSSFFCFTFLPFRERSLPFRSCFVFHLFCFFVIVSLVPSSTLLPLFRVYWVSVSFLIRPLFIIQSSSLLRSSSYLHCLVVMSSCYFFLIVSFLPHPCLYPPSSPSFRCLSSFFFLPHFVLSSS